MYKKLKGKITIEFDVNISTDEEMTEKDLKEERKYVIAEAKKYIDTLDSFRAGCGQIANVKIK